VYIDQETDRPSPQFPECKSSHDFIPERERQKENAGGIFDVFDVYDNSIGVITQWSEGGLKNRGKIPVKPVEAEFEIHDDNLTQQEILVYILGEILCFLENIFCFLCMIFCMYFVQSL